MEKDMIPHAPQWAWNIILDFAKTSIIAGTHEDPALLKRVEEAIGLIESAPEGSMPAEEKFYVFIIMDEGVCERVIIEPDLMCLAGMARSSIENYLLENGFRVGDQEELATDEGYAMIIRVTLGDADSDEHIWSYSFDGEVSLNSAFHGLVS